MHQYAQYYDNVKLETMRHYEQSPTLMLRADTTVNCHLPSIPNATFFKERISDLSCHVPRIMDGHLDLFALTPGSTNVCLIMDCWV